MSAPVQRGVGQHEFAGAANAVEPPKPLTAQKPAAAGQPNPSGNLSSTYLLSRAGLTDDQKLRVALARRQCWVRAAQAGSISLVVGYSACVIAGKFVKLPRHTLTMAPLCIGLSGYFLGAWYGGTEGAVFMQDVLRDLRVS